MNCSFLIACVPQNPLLLTYSCEGEWFAQILSIWEIANKIGFRDCSWEENFSIYEIVEGVPMPRTFTVEDLTVYVYDTDGNLICYAEYEDH